MENIYEFKQIEKINTILVNKIGDVPGALDDLKKTLEIEAVKSGLEYTLPVTFLLFTYKDSDNLIQNKSGLKKGQLYKIDIEGINPLIINLKNEVLISYVESVIKDFETLGKSYVSMYSDEIDLLTPLIVSQIFPDE